MKEKLQIGSEFFEIDEVEYESANRLKITFAAGVNVAALTFAKSMMLFTAGFMPCATYEGFMTVYRKDGNTVILSNDGTVYEAPEEKPVITVELTEEEKAQAEAEQARQEQITEITAQIVEVDTEFNSLSYIAVEIAIGRSKKSDYTKEIKRMNELADKKNELEKKLAELKGEE